MVERKDAREVPSIEQEHADPIAEIISHPCAIHRHPFMRDSLIHLANRTECSLVDICDEQLSKTFLDHKNYC